MMLIVLLVMLLVFVIAMAVVIYNDPIDKAIRRIYNDKKENTITVMPINVAAAFPEYSGDVDQLAIYNALEYFASDTVGKYMLELRGKEQSAIEAYFNLNKKDIESIKKIIEQSNIDDTNKKEIIDLLNKNKCVQLLYQ